MKKNYVTLTIGVILVVIFGFMLLTYQVRHTEVAIRTTFGKASKNNIGEGFHFRFPWPINEVYKFDKRIQSSEWTFEETSTTEGKPILVKVFATWRISNALQFFKSFRGDLTLADEKLEDTVRSAQNAVIADYTFEQIVNTNADLLKLGEIEDKMRGQASADTSNFGIEIRMVGIKRLGLPAAVTSAVFERMKAERQARIKEIEAEGEREAKMLKAEADLKANEILAKAEAQAKVLRGEAEAASAKYYKEFEKNPELANFLFNLNALEGSLKENATLILDPNTPPFNLLTKPNKAAKE
jgi:membrane protease subunit HflC|tara:strand:- start:2121 stop:3014 length:894 start_codon:yes stop_codon:yes gene_type:complete